ncbi:MAG TPA: hypothetical protein VHM91_13310, partial [Verrucomicrobiales bacterium]|nr:hypothetical protein [Verrucomicrobiales bacterium]
MSSYITEKKSARSGRLLLGTIGLLIVFCGVTEKSNIDLKTKNGKLSKENAGLEKEKSGLE